MTTLAIIESGMKFGPYPAGRCFHIEKSACYLGIKDGVKMVEFLLLRQQKSGPIVWMVEARSSARESNLDEIRQKLTNALMLSMAVCFGRHPKARAELPDDFQKLDLKVTDFRLVLVIKEIPKHHLVALKDQLSLALKPVVKTWAVSANSVLVFDEKMAQKHGLILSATRAAR